MTLLQERGFNGLFLLRGHYVSTTMHKWVSDKKLCKVFSELLEAQMHLWQEKDGGILHCIN